MKRIEFLQDVFSNLQCASQWIISNPSGYLEYITRADTIIQLLEIDDCGSVGGFDPNNKCKKVTGFEIYDRFLTVIRKHHKYSDLKNECSFDVETLGEYYKHINELRDNFSKISERKK